METPRKEESSPSEKWGRMLWACFGPMMLFFFNGIVEVHSAVLLPRLDEHDSPIHVNNDEKTWIASLGIILSPFSAILCGPCVDYFGRKITIQCYFLISAIGYAFIAGASSVYHIYIGRMICSLGLGLDVAGIVYVAEVSTKRQRSVMLSFTYSFLYTGGTLVPYIVAMSLPWNLGSAVYALVCFLLFLYQCFTPESPPWLVKKGEIDRAKTVFKILGRSDAEITEEIKHLTVEQEAVEKKVNWRTFLEPTVWKPFIIISLFHILQTATGSYDMLYYTVELIEELETEYDALKVSLILAVGRFLTTATIGVYCTNKVKRKVATAVSGFLMATVLSVAALYEARYAGIPAWERSYQWIPILAIFASVLVNACSVLFFPWLMSGEVFPLQVRGTMGGAVFFIGSGSVFFVLKIHAFLVATLGVAGVLAMWAIGSVLTGLFGVFVLTETQGKALYEIEEGYRRKKSKDVERTRD